MSGTTLWYNGVVMRDCETQSFEQSVQFDESGTDVLFSRFRIRVASTLTAVHYSGTPFGIDTQSGLTAVQRMQDIQARLWSPRQDFWFTVDGSVPDEKLGGTPQNAALLTATGQTSGAMLIHPGFPDLGSIGRSTVVDPDNGPKPKNVSIQQIFGGRAMRVSFDIEVCRRLCLSNYDLPPIEFGPVVGNANVLSNRWMLEESKGETWVTTRAFSGTLRVVNASFWPHLMRFLVIPPLLNGYRRMRQSFTDDPTGLVLKYRVEDQQAEAAPPWPAVDWKAHHAETASGPNGSILSGEISVRLTGPPGVDKVQLIASAGKVAVDRISGLAPTWEGPNRISHSTIIKSASIVNILNEPTIELRVQAQYTDFDEGRALAMRVEQMGEPLTTLTGTDPYEIEGYDPRKWPVPLPFDSPTPAGTFACYLQNPCSIWHGFPGGTLPGSNPPAIRPPERPSGYPDQSEIETYPTPLPDDQTYLRPYTPSDPKNDIYNFPYSFIDLQQKYRTATGWVQLPYAGTDADKDALLVKLHGRITRRVLVMEASRDGRMPTVPQLVEDSIDVNGTREVLEYFDFDIKAPELLADGAGRRYAVRAEYSYLLEKGLSNYAKVRGAVSQLDKLLPSANWLDLTTQQVTGIQ